MRAQVDILIVVCSCFAPTPSLASMIVNHFKMRTDVLSHNLAGMGCSGGVVALDMAKQFLQARPCLSGALHVSLELLAQCFLQCTWLSSLCKHVPRHLCQGLL